MNVDYKAIGKRVRAARVHMKLSQELLAERVGLSPTHISNIETGNTKLSLPAIVHIANALKVSVDALLCDNIVVAKPVFLQEISRILMDCSEYEIRLISDMVIAVKQSARRNNHLKEDH